MDIKTQEVYICMDDSGKLSNYEDCCCYGGVVFLNKKEKDKFITQYRKIVSTIKCLECKQSKENCDNRCVEVKNSKIRSSSNRRWIMNYIKKYLIFSCIINNKEINDCILNSKASKGRYLDYAQKMLIKTIFVKLINDRKIDPNKPVKLTMCIDEQTTKSNGYYNLKESIKEEFIHGIINYNYGVVYEAILHSDFDINIYYVDSKRNYLVQAADFVVGFSRNIYLNSIKNRDFNFNELFKDFDFIKKLP